MTKIHGSVVAITGAGSGLGRALAIELASRGARLALSDVDAAGLEATRAALQGEHSAHVVDVSNREAVEHYAREVARLHGGVDVLINNAGIAIRSCFEQLTYEQLSTVIDVNLWGVIHGVRAFLPQMRKRDSGHIVNIASVNSFVPFPQNGAYNLSKYAVLGLTETLMQELSDSAIRVTSVHPGAIRTNLVRNSPGFTEQQVAYFDKVAKTTSEQAAKRIVRAIEKDKDYLLIGKDAWFMIIGRWLAPRWFLRLIARQYHQPTRALPAPAVVEEVLPSSRS